VQWHPDDAPDSFLAAPIPDDYSPGRDIPRNLVHFLDRGSVIALDAALQAIASAGLAAGSGDARRFAVCDGLPYRAPGQPTLFVPYGHMVARALGARGPVVSVAGAEASGMAAIAAAVRVIARGEADVAIAGAGQALQLPLCEHLRAQGFATRSEAKPFDTTASGFVMAEGAAYLVIEDETHALERGANVVARVAGVGETFDTNAEPLATSDATEAGRSMQAALGDAGYLQNQVDLLVSCASGRGVTDYADGMGAMRTFGRHAYYAGVTSIGGALGFALAASGPLSVVFALEAIRRGESFPVTGLETPEAGLDLSFVREHRSEKLDCVLVTSMGAGGANVSILLQR
jgi:3-oxoacyl-[acyl-carrier-protein] synthase II